MCAGKRVRSCARLCYLAAACLMLEPVLTCVKTRNLRFQTSTSHGPSDRSSGLRCSTVNAFVTANFCFQCVWSTPILAASLANLIIIITNTCFPVGLQGLSRYRQTYRLEQLSSCISQSQQAQCIWSTSALSHLLEPQCI